MAQWARDALFLLDQARNPATGRPWTMDEVREALGPMPTPPVQGQPRPRELQDIPYQSMLEFPRQYDDSVSGGAAAGVAVGLITRQLPLTIGRTAVEAVLNFTPGRAISWVARAMSQGYRFIRSGGRWVVQRLVNGRLVELTEQEAAEFVARYFPWATGNPLSQEISDGLRREARQLWELRTGARAMASGLRIHHRAPLRYAHLFREADPNRLSNLAGVTQANHDAIEAAWRAWERTLGRVPTAQEVVEQVRRIDQQFGGVMQLLP